MRIRDVRWIELVAQTYDMIGRLYPHFEVTVSESVMISTFNSLSLSQALAALLFKPRVRSKGPMQKFYDSFNRVFGRAKTRVILAFARC